MFDFITNAKATKMEILTTNCYRSNNLKSFFVGLLFTLSIIFLMAILFFFVFLMVVPETFLYFIIMSFIFLIPYIYYYFKYDFLKDDLVKELGEIKVYKAFLYDSISMSLFILIFSIISYLI